MHLATSARRLGSSTGLAVLLAATLLPTAPTRAALTLDLRSTDSANPKLVYPPAGTNYVLHFDLYAVVTGHDNDPTNDGVQDAFFSLLSTNTVPPGLKGDLAVTLAPPFDGVNELGQPTGSEGTRQDLDGDGDLDVGSNDSTNANGWIFTRATSMQVGHPEYLLAHVTFTPTAPFVSGQTDAAVGIRLMPNFIVVPALWQEDGQPIDPSLGGVYTSGTPVILAIPEPSSCLAACGLALPLLTRRRQTSVR